MDMADNTERDQAEWEAYVNGAVDTVAKFIVRRAKPGDSLADVMLRERTLGQQESED